jgi:hypothetical protein
MTPDGDDPPILERVTGMSRASVWRSIIGSASLGFGLIGGLGGAAGPVADAASAAPAAGEAARPDEPSPYVSPEGGYRFRFPAKPKLAEQTGQAPGGSMTIHVATCESPDGNTAYLVTYFDPPAADVKAAGRDAFLDRTVDGFVNATGWKVAGKKSIKLGEHPGREVTGEASAPGAPEIGYGRTRFYLAGSRIYQVMLIGPKSKSDPAEFARILDTFELQPGARTVARSAPAPDRAATATTAPGGPRPRPAMTEPSARADAPAGARTVLKGSGTATAPAAPSAGPDPSRPAEVAIELKPAPTRRIDLPQDAPRPVRGEDFREVARGGSVLVGLRVGYVEAPGGRRIGSIQPIFQSGDTYSEGGSKGAPIPGETTLMARPGYAVGGVRVRSELIVDAIQVVFMKYKDGRLLPSDSYASDWLGDRRVGNLKYVTGEGKAVVGIRGATDGKALNALGLVVAE